MTIQNNENAENILSAPFTAWIYQTNERSMANSNNDDNDDDHDHDDDDDGDEVDGSPDRAKWKQNYQPTKIQMQFENSTETKCSGKRQSDK